MLIFGQTEIILVVEQPAELGFKMSNQAVTIVNGQSTVLGSDITVSGGSGSYKYSWSPGKSLNDSTLLKPTAKPTITTTYILTVADAFGCSFSLSNVVNVQQVTPVILLENNKIGLEAVLFPNPNTGSFKVQLVGEPQRRIRLTVFDYSGRIVQERAIVNFTGEQTEKLDIRLSAGLYMLVVSSDKQTLQRQFIIN
jgi:hypothetical protein